MEFIFFWLLVIGIVFVDKFIYKIIGFLKVILGNFYICVRYGKIK